jgi:predicted ATPase
MLYRICESYRSKLSLEDKEMLERLEILNFKKFEQVEIELGNTVVFIGPNNSGKTSALQALALWELGLRRWLEKRSGEKAPKERAGVAINRRDLVMLPVPVTNLLWKDLHLQHTYKSGDKAKTERIYIQINVSGVSDGQQWNCGLEFYYGNAESFYCRPIGWKSRKNNKDSYICEPAKSVRVAYLPPMSGLAANEVRLDPGAVQVRIGEGRTAEVLRNLCYRIYSDSTEATRWGTLVGQIRKLFGVTLEPPEYVSERGEITMQYTDQSGTRLDLSSAGRGLQQTLLVLAYVYMNPGSILLVDEPDAHLEILRQRQIYGLISNLAQEQSCQLIVASHSEVLLSEAANRDLVIAFVGEPHPIADRGTQLFKSLKSIGFEDYYQAEQKGWMLYLEGSTDLAILKAFAATLDHPATSHLEQPFVKYVGNQASKAAEHFFGLQEAKRDLVGLVILDRQDQPLDDKAPLRQVTWRKREIENYLCQPEVLEAFAQEQGIQRQEQVGPLFAGAEQKRYAKLMKKCVEGQIPPDAYKDRNHSWWTNVKASDDFLDLVFQKFYEELKIPNLTRKTDYHVLARLVTKELMDPEIQEKLDLIVKVANQAKPT